MTTRRGFLKLGAAAAILGGAGCAGSTSPGTAVRGAVSANKPRRIIVLISDGMSIGVPSMAEPFSLQVRGRRTHLMQLLERQDTAKGFFESHSLNSMVTDSAAAGTALGSGTRVFNGAINTLPDGTKLTPILPLAKAEGYGTGLVTTASITHATPAGFAACQAARADESAIAPQYLNVVDVALGGGRQFFGPNDEIAREYEGAGYKVAFDATELESSRGAGKLLGLFYANHLPYTVEHFAEPELDAKVPTLAATTAAALETLAQNPRGFVLQVEGARIDHAAHGSDVAAILWDQLAFDDAVGVALEFQRRNPDTLVIVTTDHGNSNPGLNGIASAYLKSDECFRRIGLAKGSYGTLEKAVKAAGQPTADSVAAEVKRILGLDLTAAECEPVAAALAGQKYPSLHAQLTGYSGVLGQVLGNHTGVGWTGNTHTSDDCLTVALGPGQDRYGVRQQNRENYIHMAELLGITHRNPMLTPEQAKAFASTAPLRTDQHWA